jgi:hypothetical protein
MLPAPGALCRPRGYGYARSAHLTPPHPLLLLLRAAAQREARKQLGAQVAEENRALAAQRALTRQQDRAAEAQQERQLLAQVRGWVCWLLFPGVLTGSAGRLTDRPT